MHKLLGLGVGSVLIFAATPSSTNYTLKSYNIGTGGGSSSSTNYRLNAETGQQAGSSQSTTYKTSGGVTSTSNSNVPPAPSLTNPANYYDKLRLVVNTGNNPTDTKYLIAISTDSFVTTKYIQTDNTVGTSQALTNYQTYSAWGGASGFLILGLTPSTTYQVKVKALQGKFSGSAFGPIASATTAATSLTMSLETTANPTPPFPITFTSLIAGTVVNGSADALIGLTSNADNGGTVYLRSSNGGLTSILAGTTIASATADLTSASSGYGAQVISATQASGGPFGSLIPYNGTANNVGALTTSLQPIMSSATPVTGAAGTVRLMAKVSNTTPSAPDYSDTVTFVIAMNF